MLQLGRNIKYIRLLKGWTQAEFAEKIGSKSDNVYVYEKGKANPNTLVLQRISQVAGVSVDDLLNKDLSQIPINVKDKDSQAVEFQFSPAAAEIEALRKQSEAQEKTIKAQEELLKSKDDLIEALKALIAKGKEKR